MSDSPPDPEKLRQLEERLSKARGRAPLRTEETPPSKLGIAFRLSTELVAAVVVGGLIGYGLDWFFGTSPFLLIVFFFLGVAAGFRNVVRASRQLNEPPPPPRAKGGR
jgi:ATP synthase protein I